MQVNIGSVLTLRGKKFFVDEIVSEKRLQLVSDRWTTEAYSSKTMVTQGRITYIAQESCHFDIGDVISVEWERVGLREVDGADWHTIYTYHNVKKEKTDGLTRDESSDRQTPDRPIESSGEGSEDRSSVG